MAYAIKLSGDDKVDLREIDPGDDGGMDKQQGQQKLAELGEDLQALQEELYAAGQHSVLMILQGLDTSGKDGTIRHVLASVDPQGCRVESFKVPTEEDLAHDFLWRAHRVTPRKGMIGVFNRSYYEDVLVVRVHGLAPEPVWKARYDQINDFERMLAANNTIILKFFLHISKDEQKQRLLEREQDVEKAWKLSAGDWQERRYWDDYTAAYEDALRKCSAAHAPWYIVPANKKWYRNLAIAEAIVAELRSYRAEWRNALAAMAQQRLAEIQSLGERA